MKVCEKLSVGRPTGRVTSHLCYSAEGDFFVIAMPEVTGWTC